MVDSRNEDIVVFPGSFDPFTNGHYDVAKRALSIFGHVNIAVVHNPAKQSLFSLEERCELIKEVFKDDSGRVSVGSFSGLLVDYLSQVNSRVILRGLRAISDFDYEAQMALVNLQLGENVETIFMMAREENSYISSTVVKQIAPYGGDVSRMVPEAIVKALKNHYKS